MILNRRSQQYQLMKDKYFLFMYHNSSLTNETHIMYKQFTFLHNISTLIRELHIRYVFKQQ